MKKLILLLSYSMLLFYAHVSAATPGDPTNLTASGFALNATYQPPVTYYYRVSATNSTGANPFSNVESVIVTQSSPVPAPIGAIEHSAWYIDWTSWFTSGPPFVIPTGVNLLNIFVGELNTGTDGKPTLEEFASSAQETLVGTLIKMLNLLPVFFEVNFA